MCFNVEPYFSPVLYLMDGKLHGNVEAVQNVASKNQCVLRSVDSMNPPLIKKANNTKYIWRERENANFQSYKQTAILGSIKS